MSQITWHAKLPLWPNVCTIPRPLAPHPGQLHTELKAMGIGPHTIAWTDGDSDETHPFPASTHMRVRIEKLLTTHEKEIVESICLTHDGSWQLAAERQAALEKAGRNEQVPAIRAKLARGETLSPQELLIVLDAALGT